MYICIMIVSTITHNIFSVLQNKNSKFQAVWPYQFLILLVLA